MTEPAANLLREIPSVDRLLKHARCEILLTRYNRDYVTQKCREALDQLRAAIRQGKGAASGDDALISQVEARIAAESRPGHIRVVNATGTILHTNLGRALLAPEAIDAMTAVGSYPVNLEYDLAAGKRGRREETLQNLLVELTGAEAATVVNNNAAAVLLGLNTLAQGKEVIVSRGELIEIGGAFRIPEIMAKSGALLKEVGSTNRTHPADYENAIDEKTALLLKVHTSNYKVVGFTSEVTLEELVAIGQRHKLPVMEDLGSGALIDLSRYGLPKEPIVAERIAAGADVVTFSGDKILGGPASGFDGRQAGTHRPDQQESSAAGAALRQTDLGGAGSDTAPVPPVAGHRAGDSDAQSVHPFARRHSRHGRKSRRPTTHGPGPGVSGLRRRIHFTDRQRRAAHRRTAHVRDRA